MQLDDATQPSWVPWNVFRAVNGMWKREVHGPLCSVASGFILLIGIIVPFRLIQHFHGDFLIPS